MQSKTANVILFGYEICRETVEITCSWKRPRDWSREVAQTERNLSDKRPHPFCSHFGLRCFRTHLHSARLLLPAPHSTVQYPTHVLLLKPVSEIPKTLLSVQSDVIATFLS